MKIPKIPDFKDLVGKQVKFYGHDGYKIKLGKFVYEVREDEEDGYRSSLDGVYSIGTEGGFFSHRPIATVLVRDVNNEVVVRTEHDPIVNVDSGYQLIDVKDGHIWLEFGTDNEDDYYPSFVFNYKNKEVVVDKEHVERQRLMRVAAIAEIKRMKIEIHSMTTVFNIKPEELE